MHLPEASCCNLHITKVLGFSIRRSTAEGSNQPGVSASPMAHHYQYCPMTHQVAPVALDIVFITMSTTMSWTSQGPLVFCVHIKVHFLWEPGNHNPACFPQTIIRPLEGDFDSTGSPRMSQQMTDGECMQQGRSERQEAVEQGRAQSWLLQQALKPLLPGSSQLPFVLRLVADTLGVAGPTAMHALNAAVLAASSANVPLTHIVAGRVISPMQSDLLMMPISMRSSNLPRMHLPGMHV